jgi:hypothetical protein
MTRFTNLLSLLYHGGVKIISPTFTESFPLYHQVDATFRKYENELRELYNRYSETRFSKSNVPNNLSCKLLGFPDFILML